MERDEDFFSSLLNHEELARAGGHHIFDPAGLFSLAVCDRAADELEEKVLVLFPFLQAFLRDENVQTRQAVGLSERINTLQFEVKVFSARDPGFDGIFFKFPLFPYEDAF